MPVSESQLEESRQQFKNFFYAGYEEIVLYFVIGIGFLVGMNARALADHLTQETSNSPTSLGYIANQHLNNFFANGRLLNILFWAVIGIGTYIIFWLIRNVWINVHNDFANAKFLHPAAFNKDSYWKGVVGRKVALALCLLTLIVYIVILTFILPYISHQFYISVVGTEWLNQAPVIIATILVAAAATYLLFKLVSLSVLLWRNVIDSF